jgi:hypothetical protein
MQAPGAVSCANSNSADSSGTRSVTGSGSGTGTGTGVGAYAEPSTMWKPSPDTATASAGEIVYKEGDRVEGDFKDKGVWYPGVISCNRDDGTYNIEYDDNSIFKEYKVPPTRIRRVRQANAIGQTHTCAHTHTCTHSCMHLQMQI